MGELLQAAWERQAGEPNRWYQRFEHFRLLGPQRSLLAVLNVERSANGRERARGTPGRWREAAERWSWRARAEAWDKYVSDQAAAQVEAERLRIEAEWRRKAMGPAETLGRLAEHGRSDIGRYFKIVERWTENPLPSEEVLEEREVIRLVEGEDGEDEVAIVEYRVRKVALDTDALVDPQRSWLVKKFTDSPKNGLSIELLDPQSALVHIGKHLKLFTEQMEHSVSVATQPAEYTDLKETQLDQLIYNLLAASSEGDPGGSADGEAAPEGEPGPDAPGPA